MLVVNETLESGSLTYRSAGASDDKCIRQLDWLYALPSRSTARGYTVTLHSISAAIGAGRLSIGAVGDATDTRVRTFYGLERRASSDVSVFASVANFTVLSRTMNISLRAADIFTFSLSFESLSGAHVALG